MIKIIKDGLVYGPRYLGKKDILICGGLIIKISDYIPLPPKEFYEVEVISAKGQLVVPGFIDLHVHITGGGGEGGFTTRTPEVAFSKITAKGTTSLVGCLGTDGVTRSLQNLLAKARALEEEGINTQIWTGCYEFPTRTITGSCREDIMLIDKVIGVGEIAISDHRGSHPLASDIEKIALEARVGGLLSGKAGVLHLHVGDDKEGITSLMKIAKNFKVLLTNLLPTHINRNMKLTFQSMKYLKMGGYIDLTSGIYKTKEDTVSLDASFVYNYLLQNGCDATHITMSTDGNGSMPIFDHMGNLIEISVGDLGTNLLEFQKMIRNFHIPIETALLPLTENPSKLLKLNKTGVLEVGRQGDLLILNQDLTIDYVICRGTTLVQHGKAIKHGRFELA